MSRTLLIDPGAAVEYPHSDSRSLKFQDLESVLSRLTAQSFVILGPPGSGKSTLLRKFELEACQSAVQKSQIGDADPARFTFYIELNEYAPAGSKNPVPQPETWLAKRWSERAPGLPRLKTLLERGQMTLLLDALNEMPIARKKAIERWKDFLDRLAQLPEGNRVVFSCRSLDYSSPLSTRDRPVARIRIEPLSDSQIRQFVDLNPPACAQRLWAGLKGARNLDLFRSPYYLKLLTEQTAADKIPEGRAGLFTGVIGERLRRQIQAGNPLFQPGVLLTEADIEHLMDDRFRDSQSGLPDQGLLLPKLGELACRMRSQRRKAAGCMIRVNIGEALNFLDHKAAGHIIKAGIDLEILEQDLIRDELRFVHSLMQDYFAARQIARSLDRNLIFRCMTVARGSPEIEEVLTSVPDSEPLPPLPASAWDESIRLAASLNPEPERLIEVLLRRDLLSAARCVAEPRLRISTELRNSISAKLIESSRDSPTDLRTRIAAGLALGQIGDPRFREGQGPYGPYLVPPFIEYPAGTYSIGCDEGFYEDETPAHRVTLDTFALAQFPVTNAEWRLFMASGGYDNEAWWRTAAAKAWRSGENTAEGAKQAYREFRAYYRNNLEQIRMLQRQDRITAQQADSWEEFARMDDPEFEALLDQWYLPGRQTQPEFWNDDLFNNPGQPVVGISWYEANAYCAWLSEQTGRSFQLPSEAEWESAARGLESRGFAWGDEFDSKRCNTYESHIGRTTPVGIFASGETPDGLADMTGNVWEWTRTLYQSYPYDPADGREAAGTGGNGRHVVRGGSWYSLQSLARATYRSCDPPGRRDRALGLRLCCALSKPGNR